MDSERQNWIRFLREHSILFPDIQRTSWENAFGYVFDDKTTTLYFRVSNKYVLHKRMENFQVRILGSDFRDILAAGVLHEATSEDDIEKIYNLLTGPRGWDKAKARYSLFDSRNGKPRKNRFKLIITEVLFTDPVFYGDKKQHKIIRINQ